LADLNEDARLIFYVVAELGMRPSEVVNLQPNAIILDAEIPCVKIFPDCRRLRHHAYGGFDRTRVASDMKAVFLLHGTMAELGY
jgi:integrase